MNPFLLRRTDPPRLRHLGPGRARGTSAPLLDKGERRLVAGLVVLALAFGGVVVHRGVFLRRPQGDLRVFCRAGWAVRQGGGLLYHVSDDNGWHYHYPPPFALLMAPLADPPQRDLTLSAAGTAGLASSPMGTAPLLATAVLVAGPGSAGPLRQGAVPFPVAVVLFYLVNLACLAAALHLLACSLMRFSLTGDDPVRQWWQGRLVPFLVCLPAIGLTLVRGQVQLLLLVCLAGFVAGLLHGRRLLAGLCLAAAIALKVFPAFLLLVPIVRRDTRCLAGCLLGLLVGLVVLPVVVLGPKMTGRLYLDRARFLASVFTPAGNAQPGAAEMLEATGSQSQSFQVILHKTLHLGAARVPPLPARWVRLVHWLIAGLLTLAVLLPRRMRDEEGLSLARRVGLLSLLMVFVCPVCHLHYLTLGLPLVAVLQAEERPERTRVVVFAVFCLATALPMLPGLGPLRDVGVPLCGALALGMFAWRRPGVNAIATRGVTISPIVETREKKSPIREKASCPAVKCDLGFR